MSDPANRLPPEYDETLPPDYDPQFTAAISTQMRVPDRIGAMASDDEDEEGGGEMDREGYKAYMYNEEQRRVAAMNIPDRIVMLGEQERADMRDPRLNMHLDLLGSMSSAAAAHQYVGLDTPPRVLTLEDRPFPQYRGGDGARDQPRFAEDEPEEEEEEMLEVRQLRNKQHVATLRNGFTRTPVKQYVSNEQQAALMATPGEGLLIQDDEDDDLMQLKRQVAKLHRHVQRLDSDNSSRRLRELFLYPLVAGYILMQFMKFLK